MLRLWRRNREAHIGVLLAGDTTDYATGEPIFPHLSGGAIPAILPFGVRGVIFSCEESQLTDCPTSPGRSISCLAARSLAPRLSPPSLPPLETSRQRLSRRSLLSPNAINSSPPRSSPALLKRTTTSMPHSRPARLSRMLCETRSRLSRSCKTSSVLALVEPSGWTCEDSPPSFRLLSSPSPFCCSLTQQRVFPSNVLASRLQRACVSGCQCRLSPERSLFTNGLDMHKWGWTRD